MPFGFVIADAKNLFFLGSLDVVPLKAFICSKCLAGSCGLLSPIERKTTWKEKKKCNENLNKEQRSKSYIQPVCFLVYTMYQNKEKLIWFYRVSIIYFSVFIFRLSRSLFSWPHHLPGPGVIHLSLHCYFTGEGQNLHPHQGTDPAHKHAQFLRLALLLTNKITFYKYSNEANLCRAQGYTLDCGLVDLGKLNCSLWRAERQRGKTLF